jgi:DNA-binding transcriptional regulator/RsmH inhibitor MraZ
VVLVGQLGRFEIWDREMWEEEFQRARASFAEASQTLAQKVY